MPDLHTLLSAAPFRDVVKPLPLPETYAKQTYKLSLRWQLGIALMLNILSLALPVMMLQVYDRIIPHESYGTLVMLTVGVIVALALDAFLRLTRAYLVSWTAASHEHAASCAALERFSLAQMASFEKTGPGEHLQNLSALGRLREFYSGQAMTAFIDLPFAAIYIALIAYLGGILVLIPLTLVGLFIVGAYVTSQHLKTALEERSVNDDRKSSFVVSVLSGIHTVKSIAMESPLMRRFESAQRRVTESSYKVALTSGAAGTLSAGFGQFSIILTTAAGCLLVIDGQLSVGGLSACTLLAGRAIQPIQRVLGTWLRMQDLSVAKKQAEALFQIPVQQKQNTLNVPFVDGRIILDNVSFSYDHSEPLFERLFLTIERGEAVAITGGKGSGKSTLLQMIAGLHEPTRGSVMLDTINPAHYSLSALAPYIGYMPQQGTIFRGTVLENITGFRHDDDSIMKAIQAGRELGLDQVVDHLPRGYQTMLSDTASDPVPPGVKQRIALARVIAHRPSILLFDDSDRALDKEGYNMLFRYMGRVKGTCTIVLVTQDHNLMSFADRTHHLEKGMLSAGEYSGRQNISNFIPRGDR